MGYTELYQCLQVGSSLAIPIWSGQCCSHTPTSTDKKASCLRVFYTVEAWYTELYQCLQVGSSLAIPIWSSISSYTALPVHCMFEALQIPLSLTPDDPI